MLHFLRVTKKHVLNRSRSSPHHSSAMLVTSPVTYLGIYFKALKRDPRSSGHKICRCRIIWEIWLKRCSNICWLCSKTQPVILFCLSIGQEAGHAVPAYHRTIDSYSGSNSHQLTYVPKWEEARLPIEKTHTNMGRTYKLQTDRQI